MNDRDFAKRAGIVVWVIATLALAVVGLLRLGSLNGRVTHVEHHTETVIHNEVHRLELCATQKSCERLLDELVAAARRRQIRTLGLSPSQLRPAVRRIGRELAHAHAHTTPAPTQRQRAPARVPRRRSVPRRRAPVRRAPKPPPPAPPPPATTATPPPPPPPPVLNPAGKEPPGLNGGGPPKHGPPGQRGVVEVQIEVPELPCVPVPLVQNCEQ